MLELSAWADAGLALAASPHVERLPMWVNGWLALFLALRVWIAVSARALPHRAWLIVLAIGGAVSFLKLGRAEDPDFTFKVMVVRTQWPGATASEVERELTERIEKKKYNWFLKRRTLHREIK